MEPSAGCMQAHMEIATAPLAHMEGTIQSSSPHAEMEEEGKENENITHSTSFSFIPTFFISCMSMPLYT